VKRHRKHERINQSEHSFERQEEYCTVESELWKLMIFGYTEYSKKMKTKEENKESEMFNDCNTDNLHLL
jgi:hypothetical protein